MPRYYRYKRYYRKIYPRKRWASNFGTAQTRILFQQGDISKVTYVILCQNSAQSSNPTPVLLKVGRFKIKGDLQSIQLPAAVQSINYVAYLVFIPQGINLGQGDSATDLIKNHPEYIMGWTQLSMDSSSSFSITSNLKRNLNSGDSIGVLFVGGTNPEHPVTASTIYGVSVSYQFFTTSA